jgi:hypothetical protein
MQRAESDDKLWYASHHPDRLMPLPAGKPRRRIIRATKRLYAVRKRQRVVWITQSEVARAGQQLAILAFGQPRLIDGIVDGHGDLAFRGKHDACLVDVDQQRGVVVAAPRRGFVSCHPVTADRSACAGARST